MIKPNELKIGNYYKSVKFGVPVKCTLSDLHELYIMSDGAELDEDIIGQMFEPIPITYKLLSVIGLQYRLINGGIVEEFSIDCTPPRYKNKYEIVFRFGEMKGVIYLMFWYPFGIVSGTAHSFPCEYLHQFQDIYRALTGLELNITL